jgi:rubrerythrin
MNSCELKWGGALLMLRKKTCSDDLGSLLYCLGMLERKNGQLFEEFANKTVLSDIKGPLLKISQDNKEHADDLIKISDKIGHSKVKQKDCEKKMGPVCELTDSILKQVMNKEKITSEELSNFLAILENSGGTVNFLHVQAATFLHMSKEISQLYNMDLTEFDEQLMDVARLVEEHIELLEGIKEKIAQNTPKKNGMHHPLIKYQTPDAWYSPSVDA